MKPQLSVLQNDIVTAIGKSAWGNKGDIIAHLNRINSYDHTYIVKFQEVICKFLNGNSTTQNLKWEKEKKITGINVNDSIDIYGKSNSDICIIEIDATRADQVAKKFLSRLSLCLTDPTISNSNLLYVALLYPDTQNGRPECEKYVRYCYDVLQKVKGKKSNVVGIYVDTTAGNVELWDFNRPSRFMISYGNNYKSGIITGMTKCAQEAIKLYIGNPPQITFSGLTNVFNNYVASAPGKSRYAPLNGKYSGNVKVHVYTQWREYGYGSNWDNFVKLCNSKKIGITIEKIPYIFNQQHGRFM